MTINNKTSLTEAKLANHKLCLFISAILSFAINLFMVIAIARGGFGFGRLVLPLLICLIDGAFVFVIAFTNFRFAYSVMYTTLFSVIFAVISIITALVLLSIGNGTAITLIAFILWLASATCTVIAIIISASRAGKNFGAIKATVAVVFLAVAITAYTVSLIGNGIFGQGNEKQQRPVTFVYDSENNYYVASDVMSGRGKTAVIPATFNGIRVGAVDCKVFTASNLNSVSLMTDNGVVFTNTDALVAGMPDIDILISKNQITDYTNRLYALVTDTSVENRRICELASRFIPSDISEDEIYVTFAYTPEAILCSGGEYVATWIGNRNEVFSFDYASNCNYLSVYDIQNENDLSQIYNSLLFGGNAMATVTLPSGDPIEGQSLTENHKRVEIRFEKVYRVQILDDNDGLYEIESSFKHLTSTDRYRYVTASTADSLLNKVAKRQGFSIGWNYNSRSVQTLSSILNTSISTYTIQPSWHLNSPGIKDFNTSDSKSTYVYGDSMSFDFDVTKPLEGSAIQYVWYKDGKKVLDGRDYSIDKLLMTDGGVYKLEVIATASDVTTLSSKSFKEITINVNKKTLDINWLGFDGGNSFSKTYDAVDSGIDISYNHDDLVLSSDNITYSFSHPSLKNAGSYNVTVSLTGDCATKYQVSQNSRRYDIAKREVDIEWSTADIYYNASAQAPSVTITSGVISGDDLYAEASGKVDVGQYSTEAKLKGAQSSNYVLKSAQKICQYTIKPATVYINWSNVSQTYQGTRIAPVPSPTGLHGSDTVAGLKMSVSDAKDAGIHVITVSIANPNYVINPGDESVNFEILPATLTLTFNKTSVVYNSATQKPTLSVSSGLCSSDTVSGLGLSIGGATNVGVYELTATLTNNNYVISNPTIYDFTITPATVKAVWNTNKSLSYNGQDQYLGIKEVSGVYTKDRTLVSVKVDVDASSNKICGQYTAYAYLEDNTGYNNYVLSSDTATQSYKIVPASIKLTWTNLSFTYDKTAKLPTATLSTAPFGNDVINVTVSGAQVNAGSNYKATATIDNPNYTLANATQTFSISPKTLTVSWTGLTKTYNGQALKPTATVSGVISGDSVSVTVLVGGSINGQSKVGKYTAQATINSSNYVLDYSTATATFEIVSQSGGKKG